MSNLESGYDRNSTNERGPVVEQEWLSNKEAALYARVSTRTLERHREKNTGPKPYRFGSKLIRYKKSDLDAFFAPEVEN